MTEAWVELVPEAVRSSGLSLAPVGVNETAWPIRCADLLIPALRNFGYAILGGDIYVHNASKFAPAYANWFCTINIGEPWDTYAQRSCSEAAKYLVGHHLESDWWFTLVATSKPDAAQLAMSHAR